MNHRITTGHVLGMALIATLALVLTGGLAPVPSLAGVGGCVELAANGGFEKGRDAWSEYSKLGFELIDPFYPRTGTKGAWLGAENGAEDWLSQTVTLPPGHAISHLNFWWSIYTEEAPGGAFDSLQVQLLRPDGGVITTTHTLHNDSADPWVWNLANAGDLNAYAGQTVQLRFTAKNDLNNPTSFFLDDVSLEVCDPDVTSTVTVIPSSTPTASPTPGQSPTPTGTPRAGLFLPLILRR